MSSRFDDPYRLMCDAADANALELLHPQNSDPKSAIDLEFLATLAGRTDGGLNQLQNVHQLRAAVMGDEEWKACHRNAAQRYAREIAEITDEAKKTISQLDSGLEPYEAAAMIQEIRDSILIAYGGLVYNPVFEKLLHTLEEMGARELCDRELDELERRTTHQPHRQYVFTLRASICRSRGDLRREATYLLAVHEESTSPIDALNTLWHYLLITDDDNPVLLRRFNELARTLTQDPLKLMWLL